VAHPRDGARLDVTGQRSSGKHRREIRGRRQTVWAAKYPVDRHMRMLPRPRCGPTDARGNLWMRMRLCTTPTSREQTQKCATRREFVHICVCSRKERDVQGR
jgi:hypothetical protein